MLRAKLDAPGAALALLLLCGCTSEPGTSSGTGGSPQATGGAAVGGAGTAGAAGSSAGTTGGPPSCDGDQIIATDEQMAAFVALGCTRVTGGLTIQGVSNVDFAGLSSLTAVDGKLWIERNPALTSLTGLENLTTTGGSLHLETNLELASLAGLEGITRIGNNLAIEIQPSLTSLGPLHSWPADAVGGEILISSCRALSQCEVLEFAEEQVAECTFCILNDETATCE